MKDLDFLLVQRFWLHSPPQISVSACTVPTRTAMSMKVVMKDNLGLQTPPGIRFGGVYDAS